MGPSSANTSIPSQTPYWDLPCAMSRKCTSITKFLTSGLPEDGFVQLLQELLEFGMDWGCCRQISSTNEKTSGKGKRKKGERAQKANINIAFPVLGTCIPGFSVTDARSVALATLVDWFNDLHLGSYREVLFERVFLCVDPGPQWDEVVESMNESLE